MTADPPAVTVGKATTGTGFILRSIRVGFLALAATVGGVLLATAVSYILSSDWSFLSIDDAPDPTIGAAIGFFIGAVGVAPVIESLFFVPGYWLIRWLRLPNTVFIVGMAALSYFYHGGVLLNAGQAAAFAVMAWYYTKLKLEGGRAYWGIAVAHATSNFVFATVVVVAVVFEYLSRLP